MRNGEGAIFPRPHLRAAAALARADEPPLPEPLQTSRPAALESKNSNDKMHCRIMPRRHPQGSIRTASNRAGRPTPNRRGGVHLAQHGRQKIGARMAAALLAPPMELDGSTTRNVPLNAVAAPCGSVDVIL